MPALEAGSRDDYIIRSVDAWVRAAIEVGLSQRVYYQYQHIPAVNFQPVRWVVSTLLILGPIASTRYDGGNRFSEWTEAMLIFNCYEKSDAANRAETNRYSLIGLATQIKGLFSRNVAIPVYDYGTVGEPLAGSLRVHGTSSVASAETPDDSAIRQINVQVPLRYHAVTIG